MAGYRFLSKFTKKVSQFDPEAVSVDIKWDKTKAFTLTDTTSNFMGIWINSKDNFDGGTISSEEKEVINQDLIDKLEQFKDGDRPVIRKVWRKRDLYPNSSRYIPDLFVETEEGYAPDFRSYDKIIAYNEKYIHDPYGIFIAYGPDILHAKEELKGLEIIDIAPTILHVFGLPIPTDVDGRVIKEIFRPESEIARRKIRYKKYPSPDEKEKETSLSPEDERLIRKSLKDLGYLG